MRAIWRGEVVAESGDDDVISIEGNWYFPPHSVKGEYFRESSTPYRCPWKGDCQYFDVGRGDEVSRDTAWSYPQPLPTAIEKVGRDFSNYVAFWRDVEVTP